MGVIWKKKCRMKLERLTQQEIGWGKISGKYEKKR